MALYKQRMCNYTFYLIFTLLILYNAKNIKLTTATRIYTRCIKYHASSPFYKLHTRSLMKLHKLKIATE